MKKEDAAELLRELITAASLANSAELFIDEHKEARRRVLELRERIIQEMTVSSPNLAANQGSSSPNLKVYMHSVTCCGECPSCCHDEGDGESPWEFDFCSKTRTDIKDMSKILPDCPLPQKPKPMERNEALQLVGIFHEQVRDLTLATHSGASAEQVEKARDFVTQARTKIVDAFCGEVKP